MTLTVPLFALNQVDAERCEWLVPGMLKEKVHLLLKSLPQKLRRHCVPLPEYAADSSSASASAQRAERPLLDALIADVPDEPASCACLRISSTRRCRRTCTMNFKVVDEHGRQLAMGRNLAQLRAELGAQAQRTFQQIAEADDGSPRVCTNASPTGTLASCPSCSRFAAAVKRWSDILHWSIAAKHCSLEVFDDADEAPTRNIGRDCNDCSGCSSRTR